MNVGIYDVTMPFHLNRIKEIGYCCL